MNETFARQGSDNVHAFAEESVAKTREAYRKINIVAKDGAKVLEDVVLTAQAGAKALGEKVLSNANANTEAVFDAAQAIARARTLPEVARLQADVVHQQLAVANAQTKELFELSAKITQQTLETVTAAATKTLEQLRKTA
jgi:hypothetical protein